MKHKGLHTVCSLAVAVALVFSLVLPASAVGELGDVELPEPGEDGYVTVTTPEQLARALSDTDDPEKLSKIRLGNDISTADSEISQTTFLIDRNLTLDLGGHTWTAKEPGDGASVLGIMKSAGGEPENTAEVTICNGTILVGDGNRNVIHQETGTLTLENLVMNGGLYTAGTVKKIENCKISRVGGGYYGAIVVGDAIGGAEGCIKRIQDTTVTSDAV